MISIIQDSKSKDLTTFLNPFSYMMLRRNNSYLDDFNIKIDGSLLVFLLTLFGIRVKRESFDMTSLAPVLFNKAIQQNKSIYFIGTEPDIIADTIKNIKNTYPKLNICGFRHGYFSQDERDIVIKKIFQLAPDYVICGMGTPLQEYFLLDLKKEGWSGEGFTCGGFLHQTANRIIYYPEWINRFGLRAFYRMYDEPKLIKRYFIDYPKAVVFILYDLVRFRLGY